ncbi:hypothetical protein FGO68_gene12605 [Halteria grandinella]|uniref:Uncharacterized protein n=1 Tax=Halteria grandinella TaxID=5974 RepID=A0A8J8T835_HALGN|nr:hypothetical protein FGO68_gene12605 [Halteria grandinella]
MPATPMTTVYFVVQEVTRVIEIPRFTADKIISATTVDPVFTYSLKSFTGPQNAVDIASLTRTMTIDPKIFGVGTYIAIVEGKLQDCQSTTASYTLICEENVAPKYTGVVGFDLPSLTITQESMLISSLPPIFDPNPDQKFTVSLINAPSFVDFKDSFHTGIIVEPTLSNSPCLYTIIIRLSDGFATTQYILDIQVTPSLAKLSLIKITNQGAPFLITPLQKMILQRGEVSTYTLPKIVDPDGDQIGIKVNMGGAASFTEYQNGTFTFQPQSMAQGGKFMIKRTQG